MKNKKTFGARNLVPISSNLVPCNSNLAPRNSNLVPRSSNLVPCGQSKKARGRKSKLLSGAATSAVKPVRMAKSTTVNMKTVAPVMDPAVFFSLVGDQSSSSDVQNPEVVTIDEVNYNTSETSRDMTSEKQAILEDGGAVTINRVSWLSPEMCKKIVNSGCYWHKFIVIGGAAFSKLEIIRGLLWAVQPHTLTPVLFQCEGNDITFLDKDCGKAVIRLNNLKNEMQIQVITSGPYGTSSHYLDVTVILRHTHSHHLRFNALEHVNTCFTQRYDKNLQMLDLTAFHLDPELSEVVLWALCDPRTFASTISMLKSPTLTIEHLCLAENELTELPQLNILTSLKILDLSHNKISKIKFLKHLDCLNITDITLHGNPLCSDYNDPKIYIEDIKNILPTVKKIDGVTLTRPDMPVWYRNYVPKHSGCVSLVDQFLQHYFTLLDGKDRQKLRGMYHPEVLFSLTCNYVPGQSTSSTARLTRYTLESRNLLRLSDYSKSQQLLSQGVEQVLAALHRLPKTEHDPYSFSVDLLYYTPDTAIIVVSGVFREPSTTNENLVRAFSRTFVLRKIASKEYQIINEMLTVSNASTKQVEESFKYPKPQISMAKLSFNHAQDLTDGDRKQMIRILSRLTEMNLWWSQKCLEQTNWDIKWALTVFTELLQENKLPMEAFEQEGQNNG